MYLKQYKKKKNPELGSLPHPQKTASEFHPHPLPTSYSWGKVRKVVWGSLTNS